LIAVKTNVSRSKEKVVVSSNSKGSEADDFSELKKITALLAKSFNRRKFYSEPTNNNLRTSSFSQSANKKQEFVKTDNKRKDKDEQVLLAKNQAWMESSSDSDQKINANMVFMAQIKKVLSDSEVSSSSADEKIFVISYYLSESESESEFETLEFYDNSTDYGLFVNYDDDQEIFHDAIESASENFIENHIDSQKNYDKSDVDHNDSKEKDQLVDISRKPYVLNVILEKIIIDLEDEVVNLLEKEKVNLETIESLKSKSFESSEKVSSKSENQNENDCLGVEKECDKEENPKVIAPVMFKLNVSQCVSAISMLKSSCDSKNVEIKLKRKRCKRKSSKQNVKQVDNDVSCANSDFVHFSYLDTSSSVRRPKNSGVIWKKKGSSNTSNLVCLLMNDLLDDNNFFIFDDESVNISPASSSQSWLWHQRLSYLNFATINNLVKNNLVQGLPKMKFEKDHLCSACEQGNIHRKHHKSKTAFALNKPLYLLHMDLCGPITPQQNGVVERRNRTLVEAARTMLTFANLPPFFWVEAIATDYLTQNRSIIHKCFGKTPYELMNKRKPNIKFFHVFGCRCYLLNDYEDVGKLKAKGDIRVFVGYLKESAAFRIYNKQTHKIYESMNVNFDKISKMASKQFSLEPDLSNLNDTGKSSNLSVSQVDEASKKDLEDLFQDFYDEYFDSSKIMKSSTTNVETSINQEVFMRLILPQTNTQSIPINMVPNGDEVSTSHNVFNERLEDAYFDASTSFHDPSNVHTYYQPYPYKKKWTKDHPLYKIIGDPKSSVRTKGQLANSCLFSCLLSSIEPGNVAEALRDANWVSAMQEELDQFARLKVWRLVPLPEGKSVIKTKWIFKNKKDESSLVIQNKA
nr:hypothetical protein [Tanacetum cinerariifolium]